MKRPSAPENPWPSRFYTVRSSDPEWMPPGLRFLTVKSPALGRRADLTLFAPEGTEDNRDLPLVTLLHGVYSSHWSWAFSGGAHRTVERMMDTGEIEPLVLLMPSDGLAGDGSGYVRHADADYERWIVEDAVDAAIEALPQLGRGSLRFIAGLSMGGYGALRLGAKFADRYAGIAAHSAITHADQLDLFLERPADFYRPADPSERSARWWLEKNRSNLPPLRFDCGSDDFLIDANRALHRELREAGIPHAYEEFPGEHSWEYRTARLPETLRFFQGIAA